MVAVTPHFIEGQSMPEHSYPVVVCGKGQISTIQQPHTRNSVPVDPSDHWAVWKRVGEVKRTTHQRNQLLPGCRRFVCIPPRGHIRLCPSACRADMQTGSVLRYPWVEARSRHKTFNSDLAVDLTLAVYLKQKSSQCPSCVGAAGES